MKLISFLMLNCLSFSVLAQDKVEDKSQTPLARTFQDKDLKWGPCPEVFPKGCEVTVLHGDPAKENADVYLRIPAGYVIPAHSHTSAERMTLVSGTLKVKYKGNVPVVLKPGSYAYGPAGMPHEGTCQGKTSCVLFIAFEGPVDAKAFADKL